MKIASISLVKNECDIIELFIRVNSRFIDHFFIMDNGSSDRTLDILKLLQSEGFPIDVVVQPSVDYQQDILTTEILHGALRHERFDWFAILDADEFLLGERSILEEELSLLPQDFGASLNWIGYAPEKNQRFWDSSNPLYTMFRPRANEFRQYKKVILPHNLAHKAVLDMGNHSASVDSEPLPQILLNTRLAHVPVRSPEQLITKALIGSHSFSLKENRGKRDGFHWDLIAEIVRNHSYNLNDSLLQELACGYSLYPSDPINTELLTAPLIGRESDVIIYKELCKIDTVERLDSFIASVCQLFRSSAKSSYESEKTMGLF